MYLYVLCNLFPVHTIASSKGHLAICIIINVLFWIKYSNLLSFDSFKILKSISAGGADP